MAEAFLQIVLKNLSSLMEKEIGLIMGVDEEMKRLSSTLTTIQAVLEDAEEKQLQSKPIRDWLRKLTNLAYEIDDVLDECATHVSIMKHRNTKFSRYSLEKILSRRKMGRRIKQVATKLDGVAAERANFHLREFAAIQTPREVAATRETGSLLSEPHHVYGREDDTEKIVDMLVNRVQEIHEISVLPIIGVGGLGKTTLAQLVYNDPRVVDHFEEKLWVCVSDNFDVKTLIKAMLESATGSGFSDSDLQHLDALQRRLRELLNQKRYLLVLDDVWNEHQHKWFELLSILACGSAGASIIVTTRLKMVADIMGTLPTYYLAGLSEEHCWILLRHRAFGGETKVYSNLEAIGKEIAKKCAGVPLAAKALGGVLRFKRREDEWTQVRESDIWNLSPDEALIVPALRLSYHHLPLSLRQCFGYWAAFSKDYTIEKGELIFLWMAHGYISSKDGVEVEDLGNEICTQLILRSLLQVNEHGRLHMHDLVHDLAESIMESKIPGKQVEENFTSSSCGKIRQVNLESKHVAFPKSIQLDMDMTYILRKFTRLRVLDAKRTSIKDLSSEISNLKHLRSLNLCASKIHTLPNSLCSLWNLKILNLIHCKDLVALPKNMRFLKNLRHLLLEGCDSLSVMPPRIGEMSCLKTLSLFIVGVSRGNKLEELQFLNLGGELKIRHMERVESYMDAKKANLALKKNLRGLKLVWERKSSVSRLREEIDEEVLEGLQPHPSLEL
ncbi:hypothetical protein ACS0TY_011883 [Phlomoides rotata]